MTPTSLGTAKGTRAPAGEINAYLATALTGLRPHEREHVFQISDVTAAVCDEAGIALYQPRAATDPVHNPAIPDYEVFRRDRQRVRRSDLLIYLADYPSTGAGLELVFAYEALIPIVVVASEEVTVSRMVTGIPGPVFMVRYNDPKELRVLLAEQFSRLLPRLKAKRPSLRRDHLNHVGARIRELREVRHMSHDDLAQRMAADFFTAEQISEWEDGSDIENNLPMTYLLEIAAALDVGLPDLFS